MLLGDPSRPLAVLSQVLLQKLRQTAMNIIQLTAHDLHIVPSLSVVTIAAVYLLLALPPDGEALRSVLPGLSEGQRHSQVRAYQRGCTCSSTKALTTAHQVVAIAPPSRSMSCAVMLTVLTSVPTGGMSCLQQLASAAAAVVAQCGIVRPPPVAFVRASLLHQHWAVRHAAMQSLVAYTRAAVDDSDLRSVVPAELQASGMRHVAPCLLLDQADRCMCHIQHD